jgi:hypothetical protein
MPMLTSWLYPGGIGIFQKQHVPMFRTFPPFLVGGISMSKKGMVFVGGSTHQVNEKQNK